MIDYEKLVKRIDFNESNEKERVNVPKVPSVPLDLMKELLPKGKINAIGKKELAIATKSSEREVARNIQVLRRNGELIGSCKNGYYYFENTDEMKEFYERTEKKLKGSFYTISAIRKALNNE